MSAYTLAEVNAEIDHVKRAIRASTGSISASIGGRSYSRHDLPALRDQLSFLLRERRRLLAAQAGIPSPGASVPRFPAPGSGR